jgi:hypothetical protein
MEGYPVAREFFQDLWKSVQTQFSLVDRDDIVEEDLGDSLELVVEQARQEWVNAKSFFDNVVDPALVDYAVYSIEAAERKYVYLLNKARASRT